MKAMFIMWATAGVALSAGLPAGGDEQSRIQGAYLGCETPGAKPEIFASGLVSTGLNEAFATVSPDGNDVLFGNVEPPFPIIVQISRTVEG